MSITNATKLWISFQSAVIFFCIAHPMTFSVTNDIFVKLNLPETINSSGVPTLFGMILHSLVYLTIVRLMMG
jgi:hypothetical protein